MRPRCTLLQSRTLQFLIESIPELQRLRPPEDPASVDYIQRLKASEGTAFVSSTQEWKRRMLSPAAAPHPANALAPATVSHACCRTLSTRRGPVCNCIAVVIMSRGIVLRGHRVMRLTLVMFRILGWRAIRVVTPAGRPLAIWWSHGPARRLCPAGTRQAPL